MTVFVLIKEYQNEYGFVDTSIEGVFKSVHDAREREAADRRRAREEGLVAEDEGSDGAWEVSWQVEEHAIS